MGVHRAPPGGAAKAQEPSTVKRLFYGRTSRMRRGRRRPPSSVTLTSLRTHSPKRNLRPSVRPSCLEQYWNALIPGTTEDLKPRLLIQLRSTNLLKTTRAQRGPDWSGPPC